MDNEKELNIPPFEEQKTEYVPTLTLTPEEDEMNAASFNSMQANLPSLETPDSLADIKVDEKRFTEAEQKMIDDFAKKIDITNANTIMQFGSAPQKKLADFSSKALDSVRTKDLGDTGKMLSSVVTELKDFDPSNEEKGAFGFFHKTKNKIESMTARYEKVEKNVDRIADVLEEHQIRLMKDTALLDQMFELNNQYFKELTMYIAAGKKKLNEVRNVDLVQARQRAQQSGLAEDAQAVKDLADYCDRFEKKLYDLDLSRMVSIQTAPQLRLLQNSNTMMVEKIQTTIMNTIPLWKNQMVIALGINHATQAAKAQREVSEMTNALLKKNAQALHDATVETAKESNRGIVDIETLKETNEKLIQTFDDVLAIQQEGRQQRAAAERELIAMENQIRQKLLDIKGR